MSRCIPVFLGALVLLVAGAAAAEWARTTTPGQVTFKATGPGGFRFEGKTSEVGVKETEKTLTVIVPLKNLETGISLRDKHMKEKYLEVEKFPDATLEVPRADLKVPAKADEKITAKGTFSLHGKSKEIAFTYSGSCNAANVCDVHGETTINMKDFDIQVPVYLGITVKPEVGIQTTFQLQRTVAAAPPAPTPPPSSPTPPAPAPK